MVSSRIRNTKRNIVVSFSFTLLTLLFEFLSRQVIVHVLGSQYLGLTSLFVSVLRILNIAELGFSGAIIYNMYSPLAKGDTKKVCALLAYYKRIYRVIGIVVVAVGLALIPIIPLLIKDTSLPEGMNIYLLYFLYLINTGIGYFLFAYKTSLLEALQRVDLSKLSYLIVSVGQYLLQLSILFFTKNFYYFVVVQIMGTAAKNIVAAWIANKKFPQYRCVGQLSKDEKNDIISRVKGLMIGNVSALSYTSFDSLILSAILGLTSVAIYNNYLTVFTGVASFITLIRGAMQASVGNSIACEPSEKNYQNMLLWQFLFSMIASWCAACMLSLYQPFMTLWMGEELLLPMSDVVLLCCWFVVSVVQHSYFLYLSGCGLWWEIRMSYIFSAVSNIVLNLVLGVLFGITGIIFASLISSVVFCLIWQCMIVFKVYFKRSPVQFFKRQLVYLVLCGVVALMTYLVCSLISLSGFSGLILRMGVCLTLPTGLLILIYCKTPMFKEAVHFMKKVIKR